MSEDRNESPLRDLARKLQDVAYRHICASQVVDLMRVVDQHINAMAYIEETRTQARDEAMQEYRR